jgi:NADH:ubiquinone oxidoreductase subunit 4 (subunit M)
MLTTLLLIPLIGFIVISMMNFRTTESKEKGKLLALAVSLITFIQSIRI